MKYFRKEGKVIKCWCDSLEEEAIEQAYNVAALPFLYKHVVLLPDTHLGYGMPIGCVIACKGYIIPNAVGSDIGCVDKETEYLTQTGWKKFPKYKGEKIFQYNKNTDVASLVYPQRYIKKKTKGFFHFKNNASLDQMLSKNHKILIWKGFKGKGYKHTQDYTAEEFVTKHASLKKGISGAIKTTFNLEQDTSVPYSDDEIRAIIMISADGRIRKRKTLPLFVEMHFRKERKIKRTVELLEKLNLPYKKYQDSFNGTYISFHFKHAIKNLKVFWKATKEQLKIVADESLLWDGHIGKHRFYSTTNKENADLIQYAFAVNEIRCGIYKVKYKNKKWNPVYSVFLTDNEYISISKNSITNIAPKDSMEYCFTVPSGYFLARRNNKIFITGNCGMIAVRTSYKDEIKEETLKRILSAVRSVVPIGMGKNHKTPCDISSMPPLPHSGYVDTLIDPARYQLGTLGSGNHFLEFQRDEENNLWIMIHSGSRKLGKAICDHHNDIAREFNTRYFSTVDIKHELAFLPMDTLEGMSYFEDMLYATDFALRNRQKMAYETMEVLKNCILKYDGKKVSFKDMINIHHNYASLENHFGKNVYIHRKGATRARKGETCIIPGSQGTCSYIVKGLGNPESFMSCSHGAGRKLGRKAAKKELNLKKEIKFMEDQGIIHNIRDTSDLDEAVGAYKNIDVVMHEQRDLVKIKHELKPIAVLKG